MEAWSGSALGMFRMSCMLPAERIASVCFIVSRDMLEYQTAPCSVCVATRDSTAIPQSAEHCSIHLYHY